MLKCLECDGQTHYVSFKLHRSGSGNYVAAIYD